MIMDSWIIVSLPSTVQSSSLLFSSPTPSLIIRTAAPGPPSISLRSQSICLPEPSVLVEFFYIIFSKK